MHIPFFICAAGAVNTRRGLLAALGKITHSGGKNNNLYVFREACFQKKFCLHYIPAVHLVCFLLNNRNISQYSIYFPRNLVLQSFENNWSIIHPVIEHINLSEEYILNVYIQEYIYWNAYIENLQFLYHYLLLFSFLLWQSNKILFFSSLPIIFEE